MVRPWPVHAQLSHRAADKKLTAQLFASLPTGLLRETSPRPLPSSPPSHGAAATAHLNHAPVLPWVQARVPAPGHDVPAASRSIRSFPSCVGRGPRAGGRQPPAADTAGASAGEPARAVGKGKGRGFSAAPWLALPSVHIVRAGLTQTRLHLARPPPALSTPLRAVRGPGTSLLAKGHDFVFTRREKGFIFNLFPPPSFLLGNG